MKLKKIASSLIICMTVIAGSFNLAFADGANVVTLGVNLSAAQKQQMLDYFGVKKDEVLLLDVTNKEERQYLQGVATEAQLGKATISCSYVEPTTKGGINVKTANLTWVTSSMIASTLSTAGLEHANVLAAAPYKVSGTGALTGIMKAFEDASGEKLDTEKKELASEELVTTGNLGDEIGQEKAAGVINDIKKEVIKDGVSGNTQIADVINNVTNNYNITLTQEQIDQIIALMEKIAKQNYDYNSVKSTLNNVTDNVSAELKNLGETVDGEGFFSSVKNWFSGLFSGGSSGEEGILAKTNDSALGEGAIIDSTDKDIMRTVDDMAKKAGDGLDKAADTAKDLKKKTEDAVDSPEAKGFFASIVDWFKNLFN
ncbi:MAG: DUF1002 domain-containing protein [Clostridioides sp.]|nr:DUF1002 domain-containing protein [Clostridioides sp.]